MNMNTNTGTQSDLKAGVNIGQVFGGYFSNLEVAQSFIDIGISNIGKDLPQNIKLVDFGGGQGLLVKVVKKYLKSNGHEVEASVVDANKYFLEVAKKEGLKVICADLGTVEVEADLLIMRAVNHYNSLSGQLIILKNTFKCLKEDGFLVSQISSGSEANCRLRTEICNLKSLGRSDNGGSYYWTSAEEYIQLLERAGFKNNVVVGEAQSCTWTPEEMWDRFNEKQEKEVKGVELEKIKNRKKVFLNEAYELIREYVGKFSKEVVDVKLDENEKAIIRYEYPIIKSKKISTIKKDNK